MFDIVLDMSRKSSVLLYYLLSLTLQGFPLQMKAFSIFVIVILLHETWILQPR